MYVMDAHTNPHNYACKQEREGGGEEGGRGGGERRISQGRAKITEQRISGSSM